MNPKWKWFFPGYLMALPHTLAGILICLVFYRSRSWRWDDGCLECIAGRSKGVTRIWGRPAAQTHGFLIVYSDGFMRMHLPIRVHERVHVWQAFMGGPLYALLYGIFFLALFARNGFRDWHTAYRDNPFERQAYAAHRDRRWQGKWGD